MMSELNEQIIGMAISHFQNRSVTPVTLRDFIERTRGFFPELDIDGEKLFSVLEAKLTISIVDEAMILGNTLDHIDWFNPDTGMVLEADREIEWHFWSHYRDYLLFNKNRNTNIVDSLDNFTNLILSRIEDPKREGVWDLRGMVVGSVQSGKTSNYTALITKAADAGYKLFIILAGVHNSLRSQTQYRINEEFLGYDIDKVRKTTGNEARIGVRNVFSDHKTVNTLTSSNDAGDFKTAVARNAGIIPSMTGDPIVLVVKKNVSILKNIIDWATTLGEADSEGRKVVKNVPMILIDDECDFASVNTKAPEFDESGKIIAEWDPTKTNLRIRELLSAFDKSIYIGYTATPFANIFIHKDLEHPKFGEDLFPRNFLISLPQPTNYVGPEEAFGLRGDPDVGIEKVEPLPLLVEVDDFETIIPSKHKNDLEILVLPESLIEAIKSFILACAARRLRTSGTPHTSMLIHVTRFTAVQANIKQLVEDQLRKQAGRIMSAAKDSSEKLEDYRALWEKNFIPATKEMMQRGFEDAELHKWDVVKKELYGVMRSIKIKAINGLIGDTLEYREKELQARDKEKEGIEISWKDRGTNVIAIGGDKLSRGLTLDGLVVSYYLRASRMYDTLMQMGRWFGYRDGYNDLCRIYTSSELIDWYRFIAMASRELRNDFEYMAAIGGTPEKFGLKVRSHPGMLAVTSAGKARDAQKMKISFAGERPMTVVFDPRETKNNFIALETLVHDIGRKPDKKLDKNKPRYHWSNVEPDFVVKFLKTYKTQEIAKKVVDPDRIAEFIEKQKGLGELIDWHVVLVSSSQANHRLSVGGLDVGCVTRKPLVVEKEKISIGTLISPSDELIDLTDEELAQARAFDRLHSKKIIGENEIPKGATIRNQRPITRGLILIYICVNEAEDHMAYGLRNGEEVVGFATSFPASESAEPVEYVVNPVYREDTI
ncbi:MAG: Z1 domain-containing protein [Thermoleophilia bacterium]